MRVCVLYVCACSACVCVCVCVCVVSSGWQKKKKRRTNSTLSLFIKALFGFLKETDKQYTLVKALFGFLKENDKQYAFIKAFFSVLKPHTHRHLEQSPPRHQVTLSSFKSKIKTFLRIFQFPNNIVLCPYETVQCVRVCILCACRCASCAQVCLVDVCVLAFIKLLITLHRYALLMSVCQPLSSC